MESCDVLIVGGGPAGSSCAWQLRQCGYDVVVMDKAIFPRDKTCAGWIVPQVIESLQLDVGEYASSRVWQPISGFGMELWDRPGITVRFDHAVSYGIRRSEFDDYLLRRSGARLRLGESLRHIERSGDRWIINGEISAPMLVGAGGHFCPVARHVRRNQPSRSPLITAIEVEYPLDEPSVGDSIDGETPRLFFCKDLSGYGWCVRKKQVLNLGIGRIGVRDVPSLWEDLLKRLRSEQVVSGELPKSAHGHAYHVYDGGRETMVDDGVVLIGDAAGLADSRSGEGIRPAIESGLLAASVIFDASGSYDRFQLMPYVSRIQQRFGTRRASSRMQRVMAWQARAWNWLIRQDWFSRHVILNHWFLHLRTAPLRVTL